MKLIVISRVWFSAIPMVGPAWVNISQPILSNTGCICPDTTGPLWAAASAPSTWDREAAASMGVFGSGYSCGLAHGDRKG